MPISSHFVIFAENCFDAMTEVAELISEPLANVCCQKILPFIWAQLETSEHGCSGHVS